MTDGHDAEFAQPLLDRGALLHFLGEAQQRIEQIGNVRRRQEDMWRQVTPLLDHAIVNRPIGLGKLLRVG